MGEDRRTDHGLARWLAELAGGVLRSLRADLGFADPAALGAAGDRQSNEVILGELARWRPLDAVLSEEALDDPIRLASERVWIIDPLDGTREYAEPERVDWAVHVGLWCQGRLAAGALGLPARFRVLATDLPPACPPIDPAGPLRLAVSRTRPPVWLPALTRELGRFVPVPMGSAGAKIAAVIDGAADAYIHQGGQSEWDSAAPVAVAIATGLHASRLDGTPLAYNKPDPAIPDLVVCRKDLAPRLLAALAARLG